MFPEAGGVSEQRWETYAPAQDQDSRFSAVMGVRKREEWHLRPRLRILMDNNRGRNRSRFFTTRNRLKLFCGKLYAVLVAIFELRFDVEGLIRRPDRE